HGGRQHAAELAAGLPHQPHRLRAPVAHVAHDVARVVRADPGLAQLGRHGAAAGDRFQAAEVAAAADDVVVVGDVDVADVAGRALGGTGHGDAAAAARAAAASAFY